MLLLITITKVSSKTLLKTKKVEAEKLESKHNFKLNKMKGLSKNIWVQFLCIKTAMLMAIVLLVVLTSCGSAKNCHCNCDAYGQVSIDKDIKTTK